MFCFGVVIFCLFVFSVTELQKLGFRLKANQELIKYACNTQSSQPLSTKDSEYGSSLEHLELRKRQTLAPILMKMSFSNIQSQYLHAQNQQVFSVKPAI